jgi:hypothetical protein
MNLQKSWTCKIYKQIAGQMCPRSRSLKVTLQAWTDFIRKEGISALAELQAADRAQDE